MLQALVAVLQDLWEFVVTPLRGFGVQDTTTKKPKNNPAAAAAIPENRAVGVQLAGSDSVRQYVAVAQVQCLAQPKPGFDLVCGELQYGTPVTVLRTDSAYTEVETTRIRGWVASSALSVHAEAVFPDLQVGTMYDAGHPETNKLRQCLHDAHLGGLLALPLQSLEYVMYRLWQQQSVVPWGAARPRTPGRWQSLLRGQHGVHMSIEPRTRAVIEVCGDDASAFLGYVEEVRPDQSITLSSVGRQRSGEYQLETFAHEEWREWRPIFISFT